MEKEAKCQGKAGVTKTDGLKGNMLPGKDSNITFPPTLFIYIFWKSKAADLRNSIEQIININPKLTDHKYFSCYVEITEQMLTVFAVTTS